MTRQKYTHSSCIPVERTDLCSFTPFTIPLPFTHYIPVSWSSKSIPFTNLHSPLNRIRFVCELTWKLTEPKVDGLRSISGASQILRFSITADRALRFVEDFRRWAMRAQFCFVEAVRWGHLLCFVETRRGVHDTFYRICHLAYRPHELPRWFLMCTFRLDLEHFNEL